MYYLPIIYLQVTYQLLTNYLSFTSHLLCPYHLPIIYLQFTCHSLPTYYSLIIHISFTFPLNISLLFTYH